MLGFADFVCSMSNKANIPLLLQNCRIFDIIGMKVLKISKVSENEKKEHLDGCSRSIKQFESNFQNFNSFVACFERQFFLKVFLCNFLKDGDYR